MDSDESPIPSPPPPKEPPPVLPPPVPERTKKPLPVLPPEEQDLTEEIEINEDEISHMTQSYSEISIRSGPASPEEDEPSELTLDSIEIDEHFKQRPISLPCTKAKPLGPLNLEGTVHVEGNMTHFVAEDLEYKIKIASPVAKKGETPNPLYRQLLGPQVGQIDTTLINDLEVEAHRMATSVDSLIESLSGILHSNSSLTADNVDVYKNAVSKMSDAMDGNIKSMYTMMAKAEEVTQSMKVAEEHSARIKEIKKLVDLFESFV